VALKKNDHAKALQFFQLALKANPQKLEAKLYKGIVLMDTNHLQDAIHVFYK